MFPRCFCPTCGFTFITVWCIKSFFLKETVALILIAGISGGKNKGRELVFEIPPHVHELVDFSSAILTCEVTDVI